MAIKGVNLRETEDYILKDDPGHPDQIKEEANRRIDKLNKNREGGRISEEQENTIRTEVAEEPDRKPTIFKIGNLTQGQRVEVGDMAAMPSMKDGAITLSQRRIHKVYSVVKYALKGWENFTAYDGGPAAFATSTEKDSLGGFHAVISDSSLAHLDQTTILELSSAILTKNGMRTELEKKLEGASLGLEDNLSVTGVAPIVQPIKKENEVVLAQP